MRIGHVELSILKYIARNRWDEDVTRKSIKKGTDSCPRTLVRQLDKQVWWEDFTEEYKKQFVEDAQYKEVSFTRALYRLIDKGLIYRNWMVEIDCDYSEASYLEVDGIDLDFEETPCLIVWGGVEHRYSDIPGFDVKGVKPLFSLTPKGRIELAKRISENKRHCYFDDSEIRDIEERGEE